MQLLPIHRSYLFSSPWCFVLEPPTMEDLVKRFEADVLQVTRKPFAMLNSDGKAERLALVERVRRTLVNDRNVSLLLTYTGVVVLPVGCLKS